MNPGIYSTAVSNFKRRFISEALTRHGGNVCRTAKSLGMHRNSLWTAMRSVGIKPNDYRRHKFAGAAHTRCGQSPTRVEGTQMLRGQPPELKRDAPASTQSGPQQRGSAGGGSRVVAESCAQRTGDSVRVGISRTRQQWPARRAVVAPKSRGADGRAA